jgi:Flp pilus assembly pilin Flp
LAEYVLLVALVLVGLVGILLGIQSHLGRIYTKANDQMGVADCAAGSCSVASGGGSNGGQSGGSGSTAAASSGSSSGSGSGGIVLGVGGETPPTGPDASAGPGGGSGGSQPQPGIHVPAQ